MTTQQLIAIVLGSSVLGALLNQLAGWLISRQREKRKKKYLSVLLANKLEIFANDCLERITQYSTYVSSGGSAGKEHWDVADFVLADEPSFELLTPTLVELLLDLELRVKLAGEEISFYSDVVGYAECPKLVCKLSAERAKEALDLSEKIRAQARLQRTAPFLINKKTMRQWIEHHIEELKLDDA